MEEIRFFGTKGEYGFLSNFYQSPFTTMEYTYLTAEHFYQSMKARDGAVKDYYYVREAYTPGEAKRRGNSIKIRPNWDKEKVKIMLIALELKFRDIVLKAQLLETGNATLIEDNPNDFFWGIGDGGGKNMLGKLLMRVRTYHRELEALWENLFSLEDI